ncbi:MAG: SDR family NAD(P)-dependent oxidoreductase [Chitinophagaceae bacterium]
MYDFKNRVAIVTGAASGIGMAIAHNLLNEGAKVAVLDLNVATLKDQFEKYGKQVHITGIDVTDQKLVEKTIAGLISHFEKIDILVNCVGITGITNIHSHEVSSDDLHKVFEVNFMSSFYTSKAILPHMISNKYGRILHIASIAGKEGNAGMLAYSASKAAVICMAKVQGSEYAERGITVNALAPAVIRTPLVDAMPEAQVKYMTDKIPMKRCGSLEEVADIAAYIVSEQNSFTTGFTFDLSGGRATY